LVSPLSIALFVGIPAVVIVGLGFVLNTFRGTILGSARSVGEVFTGIFTEPITGAVEQLSDAFNFPDINIRIPALNISGGGINLPDFGPGVGEPGGPPDIDDVPLAPDENLLCRVLGIGCPGGERPTAPLPPAPTPTPDPIEDSLTVLRGSLPVSTSQGRLRLERGEILERFPGTVALFDVLTTRETEFLPFTAAGVRGSLEAGQGLRVSGQIFQEAPGAALLGGA